LARTYKVVGSGPYGVTLRSGIIEYDLVDSRVEADTICAILNEGIGPEWDLVEPELRKRMQIDFAKERRTTTPRDPQNKEK
jgi:hypothetical protein